ncbi:hypothetical protein [Microbispora sp. NPDC049125]|uniref:hypothetical protein n=1 Tax=Microbispora sp. NPDC049125 TaxID=3154929 RepID=UPI003467C458
MFYDLAPNLGQMLLLVASGVLLWVAILGAVLLNHRAAGSDRTASAGQPASTAGADPAAETQEETARTHFSGEQRRFAI